MNRTIKLLKSEKTDGKRALVELMPEDEFSADDESIMVAFYIECDGNYVIIPDATVSQVWDDWTAQIF
jgi:hypothetical protein